MIINIKINGIDKQLQVEPQEYLLETLRANGYLSVKRGCDTGSCGACTVILDGKPIPSCAWLSARAHGHEVITIEGVQKEAEEIGKFLSSEGVEQCGYCSPSFVLTILSMKKELENPTEDDIRHYLVGNLCRCSGYVGHTRAIKKYLGVK
ncbi:Nicotinate dehydrogenase small FeS subunit [bioreactor metagenome]|uniref:Nicotinate dehydrogenase small FeS subunit n=1 Tax=bioreactor metagenome TaxID=1076179 RepID=A0A645ACG0_9ZZZZ